MAQTRSTSYLMIPLTADEQTDLRMSVSFSKDYSMFEHLFHSLANQTLDKDDSVTPKFTEETNFTKTVQGYYTEDLELQRKSLSSIHPKRNCLIDHPDLEEFFGIDAETSTNSLSCGCTLF